MKFNRITINPAVCMGMPTIRGLRLPVATVVACVADGMTDAEILEAYPELEPDDIREALWYASEALRRKPSRPDIWSESQVHLFLSEARARSPYYPLYLFLVTTGCRLGEALALQWTDVNLAEACVVIRSSLIRPRGGGYVLKDPKTTSSERTVGLPTDMIDCFRTLPRDSTFAFSRSGKPLHANNVRRRDLEPLC